MRPEVAKHDDLQFRFWQLLGGVLGIPCVLTMLVVMVQTAGQRRATRRDLHKGLVSAACGSVKLTIAPSRASPNTHKLTIEGVTFQVSSGVLLAFHNSEPYCIYYAPHLKKILSAEELF